MSLIMPDKTLSPSGEVIYGSTDKIISPSGEAFGLLICVSIRGEKDLHHEV